MPAGKSGLGGMLLALTALTFGLASGAPAPKGSLLARGKGTGGLATLADDVDAALAKAKDAARLAWAMAKEVQVHSDASVKLAPLVQAEIATVEAAAETAQEEDEDATAVFEETRNAINTAAMMAAQNYYARVKLAGIAARDQAAAAKQATDDEAATAGEKAAVPYAEAKLRAAKTEQEYLARSAAMSRAAQGLRNESAAEAAAAGDKEAQRQGPQAKWLAQRADALLRQAEKLEEGAQQMKVQAQQVEKLLPGYERQRKFAAESAAEAVRLAAVQHPLY